MTFFTEKGDIYLNLRVDPNVYPYISRMTGGWDLVYPTSDVLHQDGLISVRGFVGFPRMGHPPPEYLPKYPLAVYLVLKDTESNKAIIGTPREFRVVLDPTGGRPSYSDMITVQETVDPRLLKKYGIVNFTVHAVVAGLEEVMWSRFLRDAPIPEQDLNAGKAFRVATPRGKPATLHVVGAGDIQILGADEHVGIAHSPADPVAGDTVDLRVALQNKGDAPSVAQVQTFVNNKLLAEWQSSGELAPNGIIGLDSDDIYEFLFGSVAQVTPTLKVASFVPTSSGEYNITIKTQNDSESATIAVGEPKVPIFKPELLSVPGSVTKGDPISISATIRNIGPVEGLLAAIVALEDPLENTYKIYEITPSSGITLAPNETFTLSDIPTFDSSNLNTGSYKVSVVTETHRLEKTFTIGAAQGLPEFIISKVGIVPNAPKLGDKPRFSVTIKNIGGSAGRPSLTGYVNDEKVVDQILPDELSAGSTTQLSDIVEINFAHPVVYTVRFETPHDTWSQTFDFRDVGPVEPTPTPAELSKGRIVKLTMPRIMNVGSTPTIVANVYMGNLDKPSNGEPVDLIIGDSKIASAKTAGNNGTASFKWTITREFAQQLPSSFKICAVVNPKPGDQNSELFGNTVYCELASMSKDRQSIAVAKQLEEEQYQTLLEEAREKQKSTLPDLISSVQSMFTIPSGIEDIVSTIPSPDIPAPTPEPEPQVPNTGTITIPQIPLPSTVSGNFPIQVYLDGKNIGEPPLSVVVPSGKHTITIERKGLQPIHRTVTLGRGAEITLSDLRF